MALPAEKEPFLLLGIRYGEKKDDPPPGLHWRKAVHGETLGSIADEYDISWMDLALNNWQTARLPEVNWYLHHFVGCKANNGKTYSFTGSEDPGQLLVPDIEPSIKKGPPRKVAAVRNGAATYDSNIQVFVADRIPGLGHQPVSGKWIYVFSGQGGVDFGYDPPPQPPGVDGPPNAQPGTAFHREFPGYYPLKEKPDKLEYEILVTSKEAPSPSVVRAVAGKSGGEEPFYKPGSKWYFISNPLVLAKALTQSRADRLGQHAFRNNPAVTVNLKNNKRYYFLLSPVQLGPEALKFAMANPKGLTPLLKPGDNAALWDPSNLDGPRPDHFVGPTLDDVKTGTITLPVIDPYEWAESVERTVFAATLDQYVQWLGINSGSSQRNETTKKLGKETGWTLDHFYVANLLKIVRDHHPDGKSIDDEVRDPGQWGQYLEKWDRDLIKRDAAINANAHRNQIQLIDWLQGPGHNTIETAILKDTTADSPQDAIDVALGILHWGVCTERLIALEPGVDFLRTWLAQPGSVPYETVFKNLHPEIASGTIGTTNVTAFRYAYEGALRLLALKDFVSDPPKLAFNGTRQDYLIKLGEYAANRRAKLISFFNSAQILPVKIDAPVLQPYQSSMNKLQVAATVANSLLDTLDKWTTYVVDPNIQIPRKFGLVWLANLEQWVASKGKAGRYGTIGLSWLNKGVSAVANLYNLYSAITTARYDYQQNCMTVTRNDQAQAVAGVTMMVQDVLAEVARLLKSNSLQKLLPQVMTTSGGPNWGIGTVKLSELGAGGTFFVSINVLAMFISGVTTIISMGRSYGKAVSRGDYTAAKYYAAGIVGGVFMTGGAVVYGMAIFEIGGAFFVTGAGATIGVLLFAVGGIIAAVASIQGSRNSSDDYQVFARKCFLGKQGDEEPRFGSNPLNWSQALAEGTNTWPIDRQKRAIHNLLGEFSVATKPDGPLNGMSLVEGSIQYTISPGYFPPGSRVEIALEYEGAVNGRTAFTMEWTPDDFQHYYRRAATATNAGLFDPQQSSVIFIVKGDALTGMTAEAKGLQYRPGLGNLLTTVTVTYPHLPNVISTRKLVIARKAHGSRGGVSFSLEADDNTETSAIFK
jgi:hypothetical protein